MSFRWCPVLNSLSLNILYFFLQIPHIETRWDYRLRRESCLVNLYPHPSTLSRVSFFPFYLKESLILRYKNYIHNWALLVTISNNCDLSSSSSPSSSSLSSFFFSLEVYKVMRMNYEVNEMVCLWVNRLWLWPFRWKLFKLI